MEIQELREELLEAISARLPPDSSKEDWHFAFTCEVADRLAQAEEFSNFIPITSAGTGQRGKKLRCDGYERDEADDTLRLVVSDFAGHSSAEVLNSSRIEALFSQLQVFVDEALAGRKPGSAEGQELADLIAGAHKNLVRYRFYLLSDAPMSERISELKAGEIEGKPVDYQVWDIRRIIALAESAYGTEELDIDFTQFVPGGLPCLAASQPIIAPDTASGGGAAEAQAHFQSYLCVIPGHALADLYDLYGSRLLEGNVRSYLGTAGKINKGIQATIRAAPKRFFIYNNGVSATATDAAVVDTPQGARLVRARYLQIVNGGQTTASLHLAEKKDDAKLDDVFVQMKLTVVTARDVDTLDDIIQSIAKYSNNQNKVSDADFFSSHPYHRAMERLSRRIRAPAAPGVQYQTHWFYERARGQFGNAQSKLTQAQRRGFLRDNPKSQLVTKTDLAKHEDSWRQLPHVVSLGAQKNFAKFAEHIGKEWGDDGARLDNELYFKEVIARTILFKAVEKLVTGASWYQGGYRANIVTYTVAKLACMIERQQPRHGLDFQRIWNKQGISEALESQLEGIAKEVVAVITAPPVPQMNVTEWCKKEDCWKGVVNLDIRLSTHVVSELKSPEDVALGERERREAGAQDVGITAEIQVLQKGSDYWRQLYEWSRRNSPIYGSDADIVRSAARPGWRPSPRLAIRLMGISRKLEAEGFRTP